MNSDGIGLGLTITKKIVNKSGGQIEVHSDGINKGSTFMFSMKMTQFNGSKDEGQEVF